MNQILVTNVNDSGEDVLVFTNLTAEILQAAYDKAPKDKITYDEIYAIPEGDQQFYIYEPYWLSPAQEARAIKLAAA